MLERSRTDRATASKCLQHPFINRKEISFTDGLNPCSYTAFPVRALERLKRFRKEHLVYRWIALRIARSWPGNQLPTIRRIFQELDQHGDGCVHREAFVEALMNNGVERSLADQIFCAVDLNTSFKLEWSEFVAGCINLGSYEFERDLRNVFEAADRDSDGFLVRDDIVQMLPEVARTQDLVDNHLFRMSGVKDRGARIDWPTFLKCFRSGEDERLATNESKKKDARRTTSPQSSSIVPPHMMPSMSSTPPSPPQASLSPSKSSHTRRHRTSTARGDSKSPEPQRRSSDSHLLEDSCSQRHKSNSPRRSSTSPRPDAKSMRCTLARSAHGQSSIPPPPPDVANYAGETQTSFSNSARDMQTNCSAARQNCYFRDGREPDFPPSPQSTPPPSYIPGTDRRLSPPPRQLQKKGSRQLPAAPTGPCPNGDSPRLPTPPVQLYPRLSADDTLFKHNMEKLYEMGLTDEDKNRAALKLHKNNLSKAVILLGFWL